MANTDSKKEDLLPRYNKEHGSEEPETKSSIKWLSEINSIVDNSSIVNKSKTLKKVKRKVHILYVLVSLALLLMLITKVFVMPQYSINNGSEDESFVPQNIDFKPEHFLVTQENVMVNDEIIKDSKFNMEKVKNVIHQVNTKDTENNGKKEPSYKGSDIKALKQKDDEKKNKETKNQNGEQNTNQPPFKKSQNALDKQISNGKV